MSKRIALKSFSARSFDAIVRQAPVRAMHSLQPMLAHPPALTQDGDLPVEARLFCAMYSKWMLKVRGLNRPCARVTCPYSSS